MSITFSHYFILPFLHVYSGSAWSVHNHPSANPAKPTSADWPTFKDLRAAAPVKSGNVPSVDDGTTCTEVPIKELDTGAGPTVPGAGLAVPDAVTIDGVESAAGQGPLLQFVQSLYEDHEAS